MPFIRRRRGPGPFPLAASGRYIVCADGTPFLLHGDAGWSAPAMLTDAQTDQYIDNRIAKGFSAIVIQAPAFRYTVDGGTNNVDGVAPFTTMSPHYNWTLNNTYWLRVDRLVTRCANAGLAVILNPAYFGYNGEAGNDGCMVELNLASTGALQAYGAALASRYTRGNVIWCMGGDWTGTSGERSQQWNIVTGIRSVRATDLVMAHPQSDLLAYDSWFGQTGFNLDSSYCYETNSVYAWDQAATEYARIGPRPFIFFEGKYEGSVSATAAMMRRQSYGTMLSGGCGQVFGNHPVWNFESTFWGESYTGTWQTNMDSVGAYEQVHLKNLLSAFKWWLLVPKTDTSLVSSAIGSTTTRLFPALSSDGKFALIYVPSSQTVTLVMSAFSIGTVRVRLFDPTAGTYSTVGTYANSGTQDIATGGERVIVCDAP